MSSRHVTIHDIARELGVSASTVSRALRDNPRISAGTRKAVQELAEKYNYRPNPVAASLRIGRGKTVGVIVPRINRNFFSNVIGAMEETLATAGYHLIICQTYEQYRKEVEAIKTLLHARVDAVILSISMETRTDEHVRAILDRGIRLLFFDRALEGLDTGSVIIDDRRGAYQNVKHLLDQGYRKIIHVAGSAHIPIYRERRAGYLEAMTEAGIDVPPGWIMEEPLVLEGGIAAFRAGMKKGIKPDAYFCAGDYAALGVMQAASSEAVSIPLDLGVTGFANEPFTGFLDPPLTTVDQRAGEMGRIVAEMFLECRENPSSAPDCRRVVLDPELVIRKSSMKNPSKT